MGELERCEAPHDQSERTREAHKAREDSHVLGKPLVRADEAARLSIVGSKTLGGQPVWRWYAVAPREGLYGLLRKREGEVEAV